MRVNLNKERRISVKKLSNSDLSRTGRSHQTHIGLCDSSLMFRDQTNARGRRKTKYSALLFHKNRLYVEPCEITKITRKCGKRECTKVSMGNRNEENLVRRIRDIASRSNNDFYMMWFATDNRVPIFILLEKGTEEFNKYNAICHFDNVPANKTLTFAADDGSGVFSEMESVIG